MHNRLEEYLNEVATLLSRLPTKHRNEELREMRQHLQNAVVINQEFGQSEIEATQTAIGQFGQPVELATNVIRAWRRDVWLRRRDFIGATLCTFWMPALLMHLLTPLVAPFAPQNNRSLQAEWFLIYSLLIFGTAGLVSGWAFPKRAIGGVIMAIVLFNVADMLEILTIVQHAAPAAKHSLLVVNLERSLSWDADLNVLARAFVAGLGAWLGSRWRQTRRTLPAAGRN